jgi:hypothetical protein
LPHFFIHSSVDWNLGWFHNLVSFFFFFFGRTVVLTQALQCLLISKHALYQLSHSTSPDSIIWPWK